MLVFIMVLNFFISVVNAISVGRSWHIVKRATGVSGWLMWLADMSAAVMSASGFSYVYLTVMGYVAQTLGWISYDVQTLSLQIGYLIIAPAIVLSGVAILIDSWVKFVKEPGLMSGGITAWNTFAQVHNTLTVIETLPQVFSSVSASLSAPNDDEDGGSIAGVAIALVLLAVFGGILTTCWIVSSVASSSERAIEDKAWRS